MLILARNVGQKIMIGNDVVVTITSINDYQVKVGIDAPRSTEIYREEIFDKVNNERFENRGNR